MSHTKTALAQTAGVLCVYPTEQHVGCCCLCVFAVAVIKSKEDFALVMRREARTQNVHLPSSVRLKGI